MMPVALSSRPVRLGAAAVGVAGAFVLAGCATTADPDVAPAPDAGTPGAETGPAAGGSGDGAYADGTYTAEGAYRTPETIETVTVTVTLAGDVVTAVEVVGDPQTRESEQHQGEFIGGIADVVVGVAIDELEVSRVAGSSLTSGGFNDAIEAIKAEAAG